MTEAPPNPDPAAALDAAGRRLRRAAVAVGLLRTAAVAAAAAVFAAGADAVAGGFPPAGAVAARWAVAVAAGIAFVWWVIVPLVRPASRAVLAAAADRAGGANDRLAALLTDPRAASGPLRERLLTGVRVDPPDPRRGRHRPAAAALLIAAAAAGAWLLTDPAAALGSAARLTGTAGRPALRLAVGGRAVPVGGGEVTVAAGVEVTVTALGPRWRPVETAVWRHAGGVVRPAGGGAVRAAATDRTVTLAAGAVGFAPAVVTLRPVPVPAVESVVVTLTPPGRPPETFENPTALTAVPGDALWIAVTTAPPAAARLRLAPDGPTARRDGEALRFPSLPAGEWVVEATLTPRDRPFAGVPHSGGGAGESKPLFALSVTPDAPPTVAFTLPEAGATVVPGGSFQIEATATDDRPGVALEAGSDFGPVLPTTDAATATGTVTVSEDATAGTAGRVFAAATDSRGQRVEAEPRAVRVVSAAAKRAEWEAAAVRAAADLFAAAAEANRGDVRRAVASADRFGDAVSGGIEEVNRNPVAPGPRFAAAAIEAGEPLIQARRAADRAAAGEFAELLAASAERLRSAFAAADAAEAVRDLRAVQETLTERTAAVARGEADEAGSSLAAEQRTLAADRAAAAPGPAAELLRAAARSLAAGRLTEAAGEQREALDRWDEPAGSDEAGSDRPGGADLAGLAERQRGVADRLREAVDDGVSGRRELKVLRDAAADETAIAAELAAGGLEELGAEASAVAAGAADRRPASELVGPAERVAAKLAAAVTGAEAAGGGSGGGSSSVAASPPGGADGTLPPGDPGSPRPDPTASGAGGTAAGGGGSGGDGAGGLTGPGAAFGFTAEAWGRLPDRVRERLAAAASTPAVPGFADLTARYRERLADPSAVPSSPPSSRP